MKKALAILIVATAAASARADLIVAYNTFGNTGTETNEPASSTGANLVASDLNSVGIANPANPNRFGGSGWASNAIPGIDVTNDFIQLTITANVGFTFDITNVVFVWDRSATGPSNIYVRSSVDGFASDLAAIGPTTVNTFITNTATISGLTGLSTVTLRFYGDDASTGAGVGGFDTSVNTQNLIFNGTVVPEPASMSLFGIGAAVVAWYRRRLHATRA